MVVRRLSSKIFPKIFMGLILASLLLNWIEGTASGQDKVLIEAATREGRLTIFGSIQGDVVKSIQRSFEKKISWHQKYLLAGIHNRSYGQSDERIPRRKGQLGCVLYRSRCHGDHA